MVPAPHEMAVQFDERAGLELLAGRTERTLGDRPLGHIGAVQNLKELIQFPLQRAFDQVDQEDEYDGKRQSAMTGEVCLRVLSKQWQGEFCRCSIDVVGSKQRDGGVDHLEC